MTTLKTGQRETVHLPAYHALTVIASASGSGVVWRLDVSERTSVAAGQTAVLGPYAIPTQFAINADNDSVSYSAAPVDLPTLAEAIASALAAAALVHLSVSGTIGDVGEFIGEGAPDPSAQATLDVNPAGDDNGLTFTAVAYGAAGNDISIAYVDPGAADAALSVSVAGSAITVNLATDETEAIITTAAEVLAAIEASAAADALVAVAIMTADSGVADDGSGVVTAMALDNLEGGTGVGVGVAGKGSRYTDITTPALYLNTGTLAAPVWTALAEVA